MRILSLETSLRQGSLAALVAEDEKIESQHQLALPADDRSARTLLPTVAELLKACQWQPGDIDLICVSTGPGSFTGLRIGVTAAKTLAFSVSTHLVGVNTLAALADSVPNRLGRLWTIMDAQRQELFATCFEGDSISTAPNVQVIAVEEWLSQLCSDDYVAGPPLAQLIDRLPKGVGTVDAKYWHPQANAVGRLGYRLFRQGHTIDPMQLVPNYYRKSAAEEKAAMRT